jgi:hypothetical protein
MGLSAAEVFIGESVAPAIKSVLESDVISVPEEEAAVAEDPLERFDRLSEELRNKPASKYPQVLDAQTGEFGNTWTVDAPTLTEERPIIRTAPGIVKSVAGFLGRAIGRNPERHGAGNFDRYVSILVDKEFKAEERKRKEQVGQSDPSRSGREHVVFQATASPAGGTSR